MKPRSAIRKVSAKQLKSHPELARSNSTIVRSSSPRSSQTEKGKRILTPNGILTKGEDFDRKIRSGSRRSKPKAVNAKRRMSEFARCYHSKERVAFVKSLPCIVGLPLSCAGPMENAHVGNGGAGRKADYTRIVPLCRFHHTQLHNFGRATFDKGYLLDQDESARQTEAWWLAQGGSV